MIKRKYIGSVPVYYCLSYRSWERGTDVESLHCYVKNAYTYDKPDRDKKMQYVSRLLARACQRARSDFHVRSCIFLPKKPYDSPEQFAMTHIWRVLCKDAQWKSGCSAMVRANALSWARNVPKMRSVPARERRAHIVRAVGARKALPQPVLLVDDAVVTGATIMEARRALQVAGVTQLVAAVVFRKHVLKV